MSTGRGKVVNVGTVYTRGVGILASLGRGAPIGAAHAKGAAVRDAQYSTTEVAKLYPAPPDRRDPTKRIPKAPVIGKDPVHSPYEPALTPGARTRDASGKKIEAAAPVRPPAPPAPRAPSGGSLAAAGPCGVAARARPAVGQGPQALGALNTENERESGSGRTLLSGWRIVERKWLVGIVAGVLALAAVLALIGGGVVGRSIVPSPATTATTPPPRRRRSASRTR